MTRQILIIDDNLTLANVLQRYLTRIGFETAVAPNGSDARRMLQDKPADLVILDVDLPDCDGLDWLEQMRASHPVFPVVIVSSHSATALRPHDCGSPAPAYLRKPFSLSYLRKTVERALNE